MTIENPDVVDIASNDWGTEQFILVISDHLEWDDKNEKLLLLQEKINNYISFLESGDVYKMYPDIRHGNFTIELVSKYRPNGESEKFLKMITEIIEGAGFSFKWSALNGAYIDDHS